LGIWGEKSVESFIGRGGEPEQACRAEESRAYVVQKKKKELNRWRRREREMGKHKSQLVGSNRGGTSRSAKAQQRQGNALKVRKKMLGLRMLKVCLVSWHEVISARRRTSKGVESQR